MHQYDSGHDHGHHHHHGGHGNHSHHSHNFMLSLMTTRVRYAKAVCLIVMTSCMFTIYKVFLRSFYDEFYHWLFWWTNTILSITTLTGYLTTSYSKTATFNRKKCQGFAEENYSECSKCESSKWKPERSHHCSICRDCVVRMDHHCPAVLACVGYRNHSAFYITAFSITLQMFYFIILEFIYIFSHMTKDFADSSYLSIIPFCFFLFIMTLVMLLLVAMGSSIVFTHSLIILFNTSTLEGLRLDGIEQMFIRKTGSYDFGFLFNLRQYFETPFINFWFPMLKDSKYEGYWFPRVGLSREAIKASTTLSNKFKVNGIDLQIENLEDVLLMGKRIYSNHTFIFYKDIIPMNPGGNRLLGPGDILNQEGNDAEDYLIH